MYSVITVPDEAGDILEQLGTKPKFWFSDADSNRYLFKLNRSEGEGATGEDWSEKVTSELCELLGLPHAQYEFATIWRCEMKVLYLAWQDPQTRQWFPVGKLTSEGGNYRFVYTKGATFSKNFIPFGFMQDLHAVYKSEDLLPLFANRLISKKRPEYRDFLRWLDLREDEADPLVLLGRTEGVRETDSLTVFPCPERDPEGKYEVHFFSHGLRYLPDKARIRISKLHAGERLYLMPDPQNPYDGYAIGLRTNDPETIVGYCPRYISRDFLEILENDPESVQVRVKRVNIDAPIQLRLLCTLVAEWPENFKPCSSEYYMELANEVETPSTYAAINN